MRSPLLLALPLILATIAGCHTPPEGGAGAGAGNDDGMMDEVSIEVTQTPQAAQVGEAFTWKWQVSGPDGTAIPHTAIHWAATSVPSDPSPAAYGNGTNQPDFYTGEVPQEFSHQQTFNDVELLYFRAHVVVEGANYWTDEMTLPVGDLEITDPPTAADDDYTFQATLPVSGFSDHVGGHYSAQAGWKLGEPGVMATAHTEANFTADAPTEITVGFNPEGPGTYYLRAHLRLDGVNYLGEEIIVVVV